MRSFNLPILLFTTLLFVFFGIIGSLIYTIGVYSIWYPLQVQYSLYSSQSCNITGWSILSQSYEASFLGTSYDNTEYLPIFNVTYSDSSSDIKSYYSNYAYENVFRSPYISLDYLNCSLQHYHVGLIIPCMVSYPNYPVYFNYDIDYINLTLRNLLISSYFFICLSCICFIFSVCYIFLYCSSLKRKSHWYYTL